MNSTTPSSEDLGDLAALDQQVDVAEHLAKRQERLRDARRCPRSRARSHARCAAARRSARRTSRARRSCMAKRSSISAAWPSNGSPWPGSTVPAGMRARLAQRRHVGLQRVRALASPGRRRRCSAISGLEEMCAIRWSPEIRSPLAGVEEHRVRRRVARAVVDGERRGSRTPARRRRAAISLTGALPPQPRYPRVTAPSAVTTSSGDAVAAHQRLRELRRCARRSPAKSSTTGARRRARRPSRPSGRRARPPARGGRRAGG